MFAIIWTVEVTGNECVPKTNLERKCHMLMCVFTTIAIIMNCNFKQNW